MATETFETGKKYKEAGDQSFKAGDYKKGACATPQRATKTNADYNSTWIVLLCNNILSCLRSVASNSFGSQAITHLEGLDKYVGCPTRRSAS